MWPLLSHVASPQPRGLSPRPPLLFATSARSDLQETELWFGKTWATIMFVVVLGPYLFGLPAVKVVKQMTIAYFALVALMLFGLLTCALPCHCLVACPSPLYSRQAAWIE